MSGCAATSTAPHRPIAANQTAVIGPNSTPTAPVPSRWARNRRISTSSEIGITFEERLGEATFRPSTADMTEIAGVIMPSP